MRTCLDCYYGYFNPGSPRYSKYTPGDPPELSCDYVPAYWDVRWFDLSSARLREILATAETCPGFRHKEEKAH